MFYLAGKRTIGAFQWIVLTVFIAASPGALAQDEPSAPQVSQPESGGGQQQRSRTLEEVFVTARRRSESMQDSPVAVSALTGDQMRQRGIANISELSKSVPSLEITPGRATWIYIRGLGERSGFTRVDPPVGVYLDDMFIARADGQLLDTVDLESVQVLRGPQGTLFGKNTTAGAMVLTLAKPGDTQEGYVDVTLGNFKAHKVRAMWNQPITDDFYTRVAINKRRREGYTEDIVTGQKGGSVDRLSALFQTRWHASDSVTLDALLYLSDRDDTLQHSNCRISNDQGLFMEGIFLMWPGDTDPSNPTAYREHCASNSEARLGDLKANMGPSPNLDWDQQQGLFGTTLEWLYSPNHQFKAVFGARTSELAPHLSADNDGGPANWNEAHGANDREQDSLSLELQFSGGFFDQRLRYTGGLFYMQEENTEDFLLQTGIAGLDTSSLVALGTGQVPTRPPPGGGVPFVGVLNPNTQITDFSLENETIAAYLQSSYDLTQNLELTLGVRWTAETRESTMALLESNTAAVTNRIAELPQFGLPTAALPLPVQNVLLELPGISVSNGGCVLALGGGFCPFVGAWAQDPVGQAAALFPDVDGDGVNDFPMNDQLRVADNRKKTFRKVTPMASLSYTIPGLGDGLLSSAMFYATYSEGFKAGFFEQRLTDGLEEIEPEEVTNLEFGYKIEALQRSLRINGAIYQMDYNNQQLIQAQTDSAGNLAVVFNNVGESTIEGAELEIQWIPAPAMLINLSASYNDYTYEKFQDRELLQAVFGNEVFRDRTDEPFPVSPKESVSLGAQYTWDTEIGLFTPRIDVSYKGEIYFGLDAGAFEGYQQDKDQAGADEKTLVDLRFSWSSLDQRTSAAIFVQNATDERYLNGSAAVGESVSTFYTTTGIPRTYGVELRYEY